MRNKSYAFRENRAVSRINRSFANVLSEPKEANHQVAKSANNNPQAVAQRKLQEMADNSPHVQQLKAYQQMAIQQPASKQADQKVVQRYHSDENGYLLSERDNAMLLQDGTKELYLADDGIEQANDSLTQKKVQNFSLGKGENWRYEDRDYTRVVPEFRNEPEKMESKTKKEDKIEQVRPGVENPIVYGFKFVLNKLSKCTENDWYRDSLDRHRQSVDSIALLQHQIGALDDDQRKMQAGVAFLTYIQTNIDQDQQTMLGYLNTHLDELKAIGLDLTQKLFVYFGEQSIQTESILKDIKARKKGMRNDIQLYNQDTPYLPTGCGLLKDYLLDHADSIENGGGIGDYHFIDYKDKDDPTAPWNNHFASIIFTDKGDTVTLEDAAGQAGLKEKSHWYFKMYGTEKTDQSFKYKTDTEFNRRSKQEGKFNDIYYGVDESDQTDKKTKLEQDNEKIIEVDDSVNYTENDKLLNKTEIV